MDDVIRGVVFDGAKLNLFCHISKPIFTGLVLCSPVRNPLMSGKKMSGIPVGSRTLIVGTGIRYSIH